MAAIEAAHQAAEAAEAGSAEGLPGEAEAGSTSSAEAVTDENDPRLAALGLAPDFDAAEAEAAAEATTADDEIPTIGDDALAARLAGLVPAEGEIEARPARAASEQTSKVVVIGPGQRGQHRQLQAPPRPGLRRPVGRRLVGPRRRVRLHASTTTTRST